MLKTASSARRKPPSRKAYTASSGRSSTPDTADPSTA
jgi:hypothetical protein